MRQDYCKFRKTDKKKFSRNFYPMYIFLTYEIDQHNNLLGKVSARGTMIIFV